MISNLIDNGIGYNYLERIALLSKKVFSQDEEAKELLQVLIDYYLVVSGGPVEPKNELALAYNRGFQDFIRQLYNWSISEK